MSTYGTDFSGIDDIDANWSFETDERRVLAEDLARTLQMPRGALWYDPNKGYDVRALCADTGPEPSVAEQAIEAQCLADERVSAAKCRITQSGALSGETWQIEVRITPVTGKAFALVLSVDAVSVAIIKVE